MPTTENSYDLSTQEWEIVHDLAIAFVKEQYKIDSNTQGVKNELEKTITYLRTFITEAEAGKRYFSYLETLARKGKTIGHTGNTIEYYQIISGLCSQYLKTYENQPETLLEILGWVKRLFAYYNLTQQMAETNLSQATTKLNKPQLKKASQATPELTKPQEKKASQAREKNIELVEQNKLKVGDLVDATITNITGNNVSYLVLNSLKRTTKEPKQAKLLKVEQKVKVEITQLNDDGSIKKVKYHGKSDR